MYYPKSQIKTNQYSNGELSYKKDNKPYVGYYFITSKEEAFTGKTPQDGPNEELIKNNSLEPESIDIEVDYRFTTKNNFIYSVSKKVDPKDIKTIPQYNPTLPTEDDYKIGEFTRYFCKKGNEFRYIEIDQNTYNKLNDRDPKLLWELYIPFKLSWQLTGDKQSVAKINKNMVNLTSERSKLPMFDKYLNYNYIKYYK